MTMTKGIEERPCIKLASACSHWLFRAKFSVRFSADKKKLCSKVVTWGCVHIVARIVEEDTLGKPKQAVLCFI